ncbi:DNA polymerase delta, subunit 4-domain-containing protein, partial [Naematelia encephala]
MPPKKTGSSKAKRSSILAQPTLSFQSRIPSGHSSKPTLKSRTSTSTSSDLSKVGQQVRRSQTVSIGSTPEPTEDDHDRSREEILLTPKNDDSHVQSQGRRERERDVQGQGALIDRAQLDPKDKKWDKVKKECKVAMGGMKAIHAQQGVDNDIHNILRVFDMTSKYGPSIGITRLQRWERAKKWGLNPPEEIRLILQTQQGVDDVRYRENVLYTWL